MQAFQCNHPPGHIGVISGDLSRYPAFTTSLLRLLVPNGTTWSWVRGNGFASNRNMIVDDAFKSPESQWLWYIDDDHAFESDILVKLLDRNVDIVQPLVSTRKPPFRPYAYRLNQEGEYYSVRWSDIPTEGVHEFDGVGAGGALIRRRVFDAMPRPWFEEGKTFKDSLGEDLWFTKKALGLGFHCWVDSDNRMGHMTTAEVWPSPSAGVWFTDLDLYHGVRVRVKPNIGFANEEA